ncbi:DUF6712 family protein [Limibacter armeniacum]|uniref:DUF6712 family protein n=1 Tax=Limibacter armeniacum TaxID=466084 RepID=UPI002FE6C4C3
MKTFFKETDELTKVVDVDSSLEVDKLNHDLHYMEQKHIKPFLSADFYDSLITKYHNDSASAEELALIELAQVASANLGVWKFISKSTASKGNTGIRVANTDKQKSAYPWQHKEMKNGYRDTGFYYVDQVLKYLEDNKNSFQQWTDSAAYADFNSHFIGSTTEFDKIVYIDESRRLFTRMKPTMEEIELFRIKPMLGEALFNEILEQKKDNTLTDQNKSLLDKIQRAVANLTVANSIFKLSLQLSEEGVLVLSFDAFEKATVADLQMLEKLQSEYEEKGEGYIQKIVDEVKEINGETDTGTYEFNNSGKRIVKF